MTPSRLAALALLLAGACSERVPASDVFDSSGRYLARLELPEGIRTEPARPAFIGDTVFAVQVDELDVLYVVRYLLRTKAEARGERTE